MPNLVDNEHYFKAFEIVNQIDLNFTMGQLGSV